MESVTVRIRKSNSFRLYLLRWKNNYDRSLARIKGYSKVQCLQKQEGTKPRKCSKISPNRTLF